MRKKTTRLAVFVMAIMVVLGTLVIAIGCDTNGGRQTSEGGLISIHSAFSLGKLTRANLLNIAFFHNNRTGVFDYDSNEIPHSPLEEPPGYLCEETLSQIKRDYWFQLVFPYLSAGERREFALTDVRLEAFLGVYGVYSNIVAVRLNSFIAGVPSSSIIDNISFHPGGSGVLLWIKNNQGGFLK